MTLVELLVALAIGSFLMIGAVQVYNQSRQAFVINESIARVQETAQFAMDTLEADLRMASNYGMQSRGLAVEGRALLADPRILIMDEATSSIDAYTELIIQKALERVFRNRTSIIIAHRLSTVRNSDMIVVLHEGGIAEKGTHDELIEHDGMYKKLYEMQFKYEIEENE